MLDSGWFWGSVLFLMPAFATAGLAWWAGHRPHEDQPRGPTWARVIAAGGLACSMLFAGVVAVAVLREPDLETALMPLGLMALAGANWWLLMLRPRWAAVSLASSAVLLPFVVNWAAPYFVFDPHEAPPGPNPSTTFLYTAVVFVVYSMPALFASAFATKA